MKLKVFTLRLDAVTGAFDDSALTGFLDGREALSVHEHFLVHEAVPTWALLVSYRDLTSGGDGRADQPRSGGRDWWAELADDERPAFEALRRWRSDRAKRDGKPPYLLLTNRQMFDVARARPTSVTALMEIQGIGAGKAGDFGQELLAVLSQAGQEGAQAPAVSAAAAPGPAPAGHPDPTGQDPSPGNPGVHGP